MDHNDIYSLNGSVSGFRNLVRLDVSHNKLTRIQPDDLIGLDKLNMLDISHNHLLTLEETSKTFLPALQELLASYNNLTILDKDFHGLPVLCWADLSHNQIVALGRDLVSKTHCSVHDGIHSDVWGVLKIDLQDNPILCDSALPEILSVMEINHTKITGVANCPTLSEQPVTTKRNNFLGYIGDELTSPLPPIFSANLPHLNEPVNINPLYNSPYNPVADISNQVKKSVDETVEIHDSNSQQNQIQGDQPQPSGYDVNVAPEENQQPLPYRHQIYLESIQNDELNENISTGHYDQTVQERKISRLTSEIEELRAKLQELESENERLTQDLNQHNTVQNVDRIFGNSRPIVPLEQIPSLSTIKPSNEDFERMP
ncbi:leucine rich repeat [Holotrichia oblita]|uniref:Leucine rich repeat n=1 Tax=Holotrichia oblita TaxID=644536 RepID=A0ACB9TY30_HOLOL|nr:leucine rich repeat [Holotrichia oblita]